jgi:ABC-type dipeptide/oligopeptide/nickel transport system ATPase subunit
LGIDDGAASGDDIVPLLGGDEPAPQPEEPEPAANVRRFLSQRPAESLTGGERTRLFIARSAWLLTVMGLLLFIALYAYWAMTKGSITIKDTPALRAFSRQMIADLDIRCTGSGQLVSTLSGGNQQKVCVARALALTPRFLFVSEPTRGIDIGAKRLVLETLVRLNREQGLTIVMVSSELMELRSICDRIAIVAGGAVTKVFGPDAADADIGLAMSGIKTGEVGAI